MNLIENPAFTPQGQARLRKGASDIRRIAGQHEHDTFILVSTSTGWVIEDSCRSPYRARKLEQVAGRFGDPGPRVAVVTWSEIQSWASDEPTRRATPTRRAHGERTESYTARQRRMLERLSDLMPGLTVTPAPERNGFVIDLDELEAWSARWTRADYDEATDTFTIGAGASVHPWTNLLAIVRVDERQELRPRRALRPGEADGYAWAYLLYVNGIPANFIVSEATPLEVAEEPGVGEVDLKFWKQMRTKGPI